MNGLIRIISSGLGLGYFPLAPGTVGTLLGIPIVWLYPNNIFISFALILLGVWSSQQGEKLYGEKDSPRIVIDEIAGYYLAMFSLPLNPQYLLVSFIIFRVMDVFKPGPIGKLQSLPGGWGVMADDLAAGLITNMLLHILVYL